MSQVLLRKITNGSTAYYQYADRAVVCSDEVCDGVVADFDEKGGLRGIAVLAESVLDHNNIEDLVCKAKAASRGPKPLRQVAIPEL